jgi:hypothetical protein
MNMDCSFLVLVARSLSQIQISITLLASIIAQEHLHYVGDRFINA